MARKPVTELKEKKILKNELNKEMFIFLLVKKVEIKTAKKASAPKAKKAPAKKAAAKDAE